MQIESISRQRVVYYAVLFVVFFCGCLLRIKTYMVNNIFEDDECRLAVTMFGKNLYEMFLPLGHAQSAPPIFMLISKILADVSNYDEVLLKFMPFISSIVSIFCFYKLSKNYFKHSLPIVIAVALFSLCIPLIAFSSIFKQYSTDVLISILCLYYLPKICISNLNNKQLVILLLSLIILPLISLPSIFFIGAFFILNFNKKMFCVLIPFSFCMIVYYVFNLAPSKVDLYNIFPAYWDDGYLQFSLKDYIRLMTINFKFLFIPNSLTLCQWILFIWGIIVSFRDKKYHFIFITYGLILLSALLHQYTYIGRTALYSISFILLIILKPIDSDSAKKIILPAIILLFSFYNYVNIATTVKQHCFPDFATPELMKILMYKYNPETDNIICNNASKTSFVFYSIKYNFVTKGAQVISSKQTPEQYLSELPANKNYWLFIIKDFKKTPNKNQIIHWAKTQKIINYYNEKNSDLIYLRKTK